MSLQILAGSLSYNIFLKMQNVIMHIKIWIRLGSEELVLELMIFGHKNNLSHTFIAV